MALSLYANLAPDSIRSKVIDGLGFAGLDLADVNRLNCRLQNELSNVDNTTELSMANSLWFDISTPLNQTFINELKSNYNAEIFTHNSSTETVDRMNAWAREKTKNLIPEMCDPRFAPLPNIIACANYFNGKWTDPFNKEETTTENFMCDDGIEVEVEMMHISKEFLLKHDDAGAYWLSMPYGNTGYRMVLVLPDEGIDLNQYLANSDVDNISKTFNRYKADISLPKFTVSKKNDFILALKELGFPSLSLSGVDSIFIKDGEGQQIGDLEQQVKIIVDEQGTEAASTTYTNADIADMPATYFGKLEFNRPFAFFIREYSTNAIIFAGRICNPAE